MKTLLINRNPESQHLFNKVLKGFSELTVLKNEAAILNHRPDFDYDHIFCDFSFYDSLPFNKDDHSVRSASVGFNPLTTKFILTLHKKDIAKAINFIKGGTFNYITYPLTNEEIIHLIEKRNLQISSSPQVSGWLPEDVSMMRTNSPAMKILYDQTTMVALKNTTVLITGETGVGKGVLARMLHNLSPRRNKPFISIHCGAIPESLLESELFGHEQGAFTGATRRKKGKFELADQGTIFLDEIGTVSPEIQIKLLQVLQERKVERIGSETSKPINIRVIAATNEDLKDLCNQGKFRLDLFYRLNVFPLNVIPLRQRTEDIPLLISSLIHRLNTVHQKQIQGVSPLIMDALCNYQWPGNIRELENLLERAFILEQSQTLTATSFPAELLSYVSSSERITDYTGVTLKEVRQQVINKIEDEYIRSNLAIQNGSINKTAEVAGITTRQLHKLMTKYGIDKKDFKQ